MDPSALATQPSCGKRSKSAISPLHGGEGSWSELTAAAAYRMGRNAGDRNVAARLRAPAPARSKRNVPRERRVDHFDDARAIARQPAREGQELYTAVQ